MKTFVVEYWKPLWTSSGTQIVGTHSTYVSSIEVGGESLADASRYLAKFGFLDGDRWIMPGAIISVEEK